MFPEITLEQRYLEQFPALKILKDIYKNKSRPIFDLEVQSAILSQTIFNPISIKFPQSQIFKTRFLKALLYNIELDDQEPDIRILNLLAAKSPIEPDSSHKIFRLPNTNQSVVVYQDHALISNGTTGMRIWSGSLLLLEYLSSITIDYRNVLELGSGLGLVGIALPFMNTNVIMTDFNDRVIDRCKHNIQLNSEELVSKGNKVPEILELDWNEACNLSNIDLRVKLNISNVDLIVSCDTIYDPDLLEGLVGTLSRLLDVEIPPRVLFAASIRNLETFQLFLDFCHENGITVQEIEFQATNWFWYEEQNVRLFDLGKL